MPWSGGFLSWPAYHYYRYRVARMLRHILKAYADADNTAAWVNENPDQFRYIVLIEKERRRRKEEAARGDHA